MNRLPCLVTLVAMVIAGCATTSYGSKDQLPTGTVFLEPNQQFEAVIFNDWQTTPSGDISNYFTPERVSENLTGDKAMVIGTYKSSQNLYVAEYISPLNGSKVYLFAPKKTVDDRRSEQKEERARAAAEDAANPPHITALSSPDGNFKLYIPNRMRLSHDQAESNKKLFAFMESEVVHRPIIVSFHGDQGQLINWMLDVYGAELMKYWGPDEYFLDRSEDNDFVVVIRKSFALLGGIDGGTDVIVMTYEYFMATR